MSGSWKMPKVAQGDCVLFSTDTHNFSDPTLAWVLKPPKDSTITVLAFTMAGFVEKNSVHHRDDPSLKQDHGWNDLGAWDYTEQCAAIHELIDSPPATKQKAGRPKQES